MKSLPEELSARLPERQALSSAVRVVALYAAFAGLWILLSDWAVGLLFRDPGSLQAAGTLKGLLFVAVTSVLLFFLVLRFAVRHSGTPAPVGAAVRPATGPLPYGSLLLFSAVFVTLVAGAILQNREQHRTHQTMLLQSVAQLGARQIEGWLAERRRDAESVGAALLQGRAWAAWVERRDAVGEQRLLAQLESFRATMRYRSAALVDADGNILLQTGETVHGTADALRRATRTAIAERRVAMSDLFRMDAPLPSHVHLDFAMPLAVEEGSGIPAAVILRVDVEAAFYPLFATWPLPSDSAETVLFRQDGDEVVALNDVRHEPGTALLRRRSLTDLSVLAPQALAPGYLPGTLLDGVDYRGVPVVGTAQPVAGTGWWLMAKTDRAEAFAAAGKDALWIGFSGLVVWLAALTLAVVFFQRRELQHAQTQRAEQAERLQALQLLQAIADSSTDAIFAKDTAGRYLLFNKEAARVTGKPAEEVIGCDDTVLFPPAQAEQIALDDQVAMRAETSRSFHETLDTVDGQVVFLATKGPLRDAAGQVFGLFGISRDITRLAQTESALRAERDLNQRYLDTVQTLMVALDREGRVTMVNRFGCELLGYAESELLGRNWFETALPQPEGERVYRHFLRLMNGEAAVAEHFENPVRCRDGRERMLAWHNALLTDAAGNIVGTLSSGEDISERRRAEDELRRQAEELVARNAELERFNHAMVGRELDMIALKRRINELSVELGRPSPFDLETLDGERGGGES